MAAHTATEYAAMLRKLLPRGVIWTASPESNLARLLTAFGAELARLEGDAERLLRELDPQQSLEALEDWEEELGLPDECSQNGAGVAARRDAIVKKLQRGGFMNEAYYVELAGSLGYEDAVVSRVREFRVGVSRMGDRLNDILFHHVFFVSVPSGGQIRAFRTGESGMGERLRTWGDDSLECILNRQKPAHSKVFVTYQGVEDAKN